MAASASIMPHLGQMSVWLSARDSAGGSSYAQKEVFDLVHYKYSRVSTGEKESIFWTYFDESSNAKSGPAEDAEAQGGTA